jgi:altronate dehydratase large subunit
VTSVVGIVAGGCQVMVFTTGLGTPVGNPIAPVIKVSSNSLTYERMNDAIDINAGTILEGKETIAGVGNRIYEMILRVLSGEMPKAEQLGQIQYGIWRATTEL